MKNLVLLTLFLSISVFGGRDKKNQGASSSKTQVANSSNAQPGSNAALHALVPALNQQQSGSLPQISSSLPSTDPRSLSQETESASSSRSSSLSRHSRDRSSSPEEDYVHIDGPDKTSGEQSRESKSGNSVGGAVMAVLAATSGAIGFAGKAVLDVANSRPVRYALGKRIDDMLNAARSGKDSELSLVDLSHDMDRAIDELLIEGRYSETIELLTYCKQKNVPLNLAVVIGSNREALLEKITSLSETLALVRSDVQGLK